jgi:hypothetical protein
MLLIITMRADRDAVVCDVDDSNDVDDDRKEG